MKVHISDEDVCIEISDTSRYSPDVLEDMCNRANALAERQRAFSRVLQEADPPPGGRVSATRAPHPPRASVTPAR